MDTLVAPSPCPFPGCAHRSLVTYRWEHTHDLPGVCCWTMTAVAGLEAARRHAQAHLN